MNEPTSKRKHLQIFIQLNASNPFHLNYDQSHTMEDILDLLQFSTQERINLVIKQKGAVLPIYLDAIPDNTSEIEPLHFITTVDVYINLFGKLIAEQLGPKTTLLKVINNCCSEDERRDLVVMYKSEVIPVNYYSRVEMHQIDTISNPLYFLTHIEVDYVIKFPSGQDREDTMSCKATYTVQKLLTALCKKHIGTVKSEEIIIKHDDVVVNDLDQCLVNFALKKPFIFSHKFCEPKRQLEIMRHFTHPPSTYASISKLAQGQNAAYLDFRNATIYDHRSDRYMGDDVSLYYLGFHDFRELCKTIPIEKEDCYHTQLLCETMSGFFDNKDQRLKKFINLFEAYICMKGTQITFDHEYGASTHFALGCFLLLEAKNEVGLGGAESYQALGGYYVASLNSLHSSYVDKHSAPVFLIELIGPHLIISGAVYGKFVYIDKLIPPLWLVLQPMNSEEMIRTARVLKALKSSLTTLSLYYSTEKRQQPRFPSYKYKDGAEVLQYEERMKPHLYSCTLKDSSVIVKFAESYGENAHKLLADAGFAPKLHHIGNHGRFTVVIMEKLPDVTRVDEYLLQNPNDKKNVLDQCQNALNILHNNSFCHGDFRTCNILVDPTGKVYIVDFDWAGATGIAKYPYYMNHIQIQWPQGVTDGGIIDCEHDWFWLEKLIECNNTD